MWTRGEAVRAGSPAWMGGGGQSEMGRVRGWVRDTPRAAPPEAPGCPGPQLQLVQTALSDPPQLWCARHGPGLTELSEGPCVHLSTCTYGAGSLPRPPAPGVSAVRSRFLHTCFGASTWRIGVPLGGGKALVPRRRGQAGPGELLGRQAGTQDTREDEDWRGRGAYAEPGGTRVLTWSPALRASASSPKTERGKGPERAVPD